MHDLCTRNCWSFGKSLVDFSFLIIFRVLHVLVGDWEWRKSNMHRSKKSKPNFTTQALHVCKENHLYLIYSYIHFTSLWSVYFINTHLEVFVSKKKLCTAFSDLFILHFCINMDFRWGRTFPNRHCFLLYEYKGSLLLWIEQFLSHLLKECLIFHFTDSNFNLSGYFSK